MELEKLIKKINKICDYYGDRILGHRCTDCFLKASPLCTLKSISFNGNISKELKLIEDWEYPENKLLPCPFCGCTRIKKGIYPSFGIITCSNCSCKMHLDGADKEQIEKDIINLWNNREKI